MDPANYQQEHARLFELYHGMTDEELENLAVAAYELTDLARESLQFEIKSRKLAVPIYFTLAAREEANRQSRRDELAARETPQTLKPLRSDFPQRDEAELEQLPREDDGFVPDDADLAWVHTVHDLDEAVRIKHCLNQALIECFFGEEKVRATKQLPQEFHGDIDVRVWAHQQRDAMEVLTACIPNYGEVKEAPDVEMRCPKCKSDGVVFEERDAGASGEVTRTSKFRWRCDDCGYEWEDEGIAEDREDTDLTPNQR
jgi:DNA-directed RNA polymerase subunit M/transcription elongation factor TFIIS